MRRPSSAIALEYSTVIRIARSLFQRVLESDPAAARRLRDDFVTRTSQIASDILIAGGKLSTCIPVRSGTVSTDPSLAAILRDAAGVPDEAYCGARQTSSVTVTGT